MVPEHFCLNDTSFVGFLNISDNPRDEIQALVDLADAILKFDQSILAPSTIDSIDIGKNLFFYDFYSADFNHSDVWHGIDRDTLKRLLLLRRRLETVDVQPSKAKLCNLSGQCILEQPASGAVTIAHIRAVNTEYFAWLLVGPNGGDSGEYVLSLGQGVNMKIYMLRANRDLPLYTRWLIREFAQLEEDFFLLWERAFPATLRSDDLSFRRFHGTYISLRDEVIKHIAFLNDHFLSLWHECNMDFAIFKIKAKSAYNIDFSNESTNTRNSSKKMNERIAKFMEHKVLCELHTKIHPTVNRIHFHPPKEEIGNHKILIGIFVDHLAT